MEIVTSRTRMRPPREEDAQTIFDSYASDPLVTKYLSWPRHTCLADTEQFLLFAQQQWRQYPAGPLLIERLEDGQLLGSTGLAFETDYRASTGYLLARSCWGQGLASEVLVAMVQLAERTELQRLEALCHYEHQVSARVLSKCGFKLEGTLVAHTVFPNLGDAREAARACDVLMFGLALPGPAFGQ